MSRCDAMSPQKEYVEGRLLEGPDHHGKVLLDPDIEFVYIQTPCLLPPGHDGDHKFDQIGGA